MVGLLGGVAIPGRTTGAGGTARVGGALEEEEGGGAPEGRGPVPVPAPAPVPHQVRFPCLALLSGIE